MDTSFPKDRIRVVLLEGVHPAAVEAFTRDGFRVEAERGSPDLARLREMVESAHVVGLRSKTRLNAELIAGARRLLAVGCFCIGTDQVDLRAARSRGVPVFNSPFSNTRSVAELTIAEIVMLCRRTIEKNAQMHAGTWDKSAAGAHEVRGRTLGIVGYGHIGSQVSVLAEAMGMRVLFFDTAPRLALGNAERVGSLGELLERSDVVTLHVPATAQTTGMIGRDAIARMRPGAMLINNARGSLVDLPALREAIGAGRVGGAALDVFPEEPAAAGESFRCELAGLPNVILTPHVGGSTAEAQEAIGRDVASKLIAFVNAGSTAGAVNLPQVDLPPQPHRTGESAEATHRVLHLHRNVPGVLSKINALLAARGINVRSQRLETDSELGYVVLDVDPTESAAALEELESIPETVRTRVLW